MEEIKNIDGHDVVFNRAPVVWYDEHENIVGEGTLDDAVSGGWFVRSAHVWIVNHAGMLYVQKRSMHVLNNPGKWAESSGGYVDRGMTTVQTAVTETQEELGLDIPETQFKKIAMIRQFEKRYDGSMSKQFVDVYLVVYNFTESDIRLYERDVAGGICMDWREFEKKYQNKEIDFVDHPQEIAVALKSLHDYFDGK